MKSLKIDKIEKIFFFISIHFILGILVFNYYTNYFRYYHTSYFSDRSQYSLYLPLDQESFIKLQLIADKNYPDLEVLINGEIFQTFRKDEVLLVPVKKGDVVQINGTMYKDKIKLEVVDKSLKLKGEDLARQVIVNQNIEFLCLIRF
ncbi:hypothetical protein SAMN05446037_1001212 [Anaerovirgula multivorans]|uniref:Uncharacterized protein n=1 Tax=Anaerovirgula multivorans TaxID=312168 RepID=A0A238ZY22_9FIRM|nr:hypothetical protein [Anaerovirgula multivorans]SNR88287.1 hypothetical protein SAMN05446037_1001212 [Anaerovirgula multivorans]